MQPAALTCQTEQVDAAYFQRDLWAEAWLRRAPLIEPLVQPVVDVLAPRRDERIADVGTGMAQLAIAVATAVGPEGSVLGVDISPPVLERARALAESQAATNVRFHCADASTNALPGAPFDAVTSLLGVMFFDDPVAAFSHLRTQVRPGGRLAVGVWGPPSGNPLLPEVLLGAFASRAVCAAPFSLADPGTAMRILAAAGWVEVAVANRPVRARVPSESVFDDDVPAVYGVPPLRRGAAIAHARSELARFARDGLVEVPLSLHIVTAGNLSIV